MRFFNFFALTAIVYSATALPVELRQATEPCPEDYPQYQEAKRNQTNVFALQLLGSLSGDAAVDNTCKELQDGCYDKWADGGLDLDDAKETVCNAQGAQTNASLALPKVVQARTNVLETQLLNAFDREEGRPISYLCSNLDYNQISSFLLDSNKIVQSACATSDTSISPEPFTSPTNVNTSAVNTYRFASSKLYAYQYASAATTTTQLNEYCAHAPSYHASWSDLELKPKVIQQTLCSIKEPLSAEEAKQQTMKWSSRQFVAVVENIVGVAGYKEWLCGHLDTKALDNVGLDGSVVKGAVCAHARGGKAEGDGECEKEGKVD